MTSIRTRTYHFWDFAADFFSVSRGDVVVIASFLRNPERAAQIEIMLTCWRAVADLQESRSGATSGLKRTVRTAAGAPGESRCTLEPSHASPRSSPPEPSGLDERAAAANGADDDWKKRLIRKIEEDFGELEELIMNPQCAVEHDFWPVYRADGDLKERCSRCPKTRWVPGTDPGTGFVHGQFS